MSFARLAGTCLVLASAILVGTPAATQETESPGVKVTLDFVVEDARGRPVTDVAASEVVVVQDGVAQPIETLAAKAPPGRYELRYAPKSGKAGAVTLRLLRSGTRVHGPDGGVLKPRVEQPMSRLEAELAAALDRRPDADDFRSYASVLRFEATPDGLHHTFALELSLDTVTTLGGGHPPVAHVQALARLKDARGRVLRHFQLERQLEGQRGTQRLVWTAQARLKQGRYVLETMARDAVSSRASARRVEFDAPEVPPGLRLSSVALIQPMDSTLVRDDVGEQDDPFFINGDPIMPVLALKTVPAPGARVRFFVVLYPDRASQQPVTLRLDLVREGSVVGSGPIALPPADAQGQIRYAGGIGVATLRPAEYVLRLVAQQGAATSSEEVPFTVSDVSDVAPVRLEQRR
jgi:hypothetical protein